MKIVTYQLDELLEKANTSDDVKLTLTSLVKQPLVAFYLHQATNEEWLDVDLNELQYKLTDYHRSMAGASLLNSRTINMYEQVLLNPKVVQKTKRYQLKNLLEMLYVGEAKVLEAVLTKNLQSIYPNITHELLCSVL